MDIQKIADTGIKAYFLGEKFAKRIRVGKRAPGCLRIAKKIYGKHNEHEINCFIVGYMQTVENIDIWVSDSTGLVIALSQKVKGK